MCLIFYVNDPIKSFFPDNPVGLFRSVSAWVESCRRELSSCIQYGYGWLLRHSLTLLSSLSSLELFSPLLRLLLHGYLPSLFSLKASFCMGLLVTTIFEHGTLDFLEDSSRRRFREIQGIKESAEKSSYQVATKAYNQRRKKKWNISCKI